MANVDGRAKLLEGAFDNVDCPFNAGAKAPRLGEYNFEMFSGP